MLSLCERQIEFVLIKCADVETHCLAIRKRASSLSESNFRSSALAYQSEPAHRFSTHAVVHCVSCGVG